MVIKWKNITECNGLTLQERQYEPGKQGVRALSGFLAFVLGISLTLEGLLFWSGVLLFPAGRQQMKESFRNDYQQTRQFREYVSVWLEVLITLGNGGAVESSYGTGYYGSYWYTYESDEMRDARLPTAESNYVQVPAGMSQEKQVHYSMQNDKNLLYQVERNGNLLYTNADKNMNPWASKTIPEGYNFFVYYGFGETRLWKDGEMLDVYGDGWDWYSGDWEQWYVPGYENFVLNEKTDGVTVTMALREIPREYRWADPTDSQTMRCSQLYQLYQDVQKQRWEYVFHGVSAALGIGLLALYVRLRRDKAEADCRLARMTGKLWLEGKVMLFLALMALALLRIPRAEGIALFLGQMAEAVRSWSLTPFREYAAQREVVDLTKYLDVLLTCLWSGYVLLVNDWRHNRSFWRHSMVSGLLRALRARSLELSVQKRLRRVVCVGPILVVGLLAVLAPVFIRGVRYMGDYRDWMNSPWGGYVILFAVAVLLTVILMSWSVWRGSEVAKNLGLLAQQIAAIRAGNLEGAFPFPEDSDLRQMSEDLNHIQQGFHRAVEEQIQSERMKVELVTNVSHDLKTPLTSIVSYAELLTQEPLEPPASEYVQILFKKSQRLKTMVQDVFEVSKAASGQLPVELEELDFGRLLRQTLADMGEEIRLSGLGLRTAIPEKPVPIIADSDRLYRVFQNLINNALRYSLPGSRIYLTLAVEDGQAVACVKNTSAAELKPGVDYTGRFVRGDESRTDGGSGLGLSIAGSFTWACGGELTIITEADLFTAAVQFPIAQPPAV